ncbi:MAG TPA: Uma2 family endonuclease [Allocoleopsis sp.]
MMIQTAKKTYTFAEYLEYDDGTDNKHELVNGEIITMPVASGIQALIMVFLYNILSNEIIKLGLKWGVMPGNVGVKTNFNTSRIPDLMILTEMQLQLMRNMNYAVLENPPILAIEIVSNNADDDYRYKRSEYAVREIPEYWIVDPNLEKVIVLILENGFYETTEFTGNQVINSPTFPELQLTVEEILKA